MGWTVELYSNRWYCWLMLIPHAKTLAHPKCKPIWAIIVVNRSCWPIVKVTMTIHWHTRTLHCNHTQWTCTVNTTVLQLHSSLFLTAVCRVQSYWRKWMLRFENRIKAMNLTDPERKLALLLDYAGDDVHDDYLTLTVPPAAGGNNPPPGNGIYSRSVVALNNHYAPQVQREYEIFSFRTAKQEENETLDQFVTRLRKLGATCDFANLSAEIKSQVIQRCKSSRLRTKGLSDLTMSLDDIIKTVTAMDRAVVYAQSMEGNTEMSVNQLATRKFTRPNHQRANRHDDFRRQQPSHSRNQPAETKCGHCWRSYPHEGGRESCPAFKQSCHTCGTVGHYAKLCRKPQTSGHGLNWGQGRGRRSNRGHGWPSRVHNQLHNIDVTEVDNHEDDYLYTVDTGKTKNSKPMFLFQLNGVPTKMLGDSGALVNIIDEPTLETLAPKPDRQPPDMNLYAYGSKEKALPLLGMFVGTIATEQFTHTTKVYVAQGSYDTLMSHRTAEKLNLIKISKKAVIANLVINSNAESIAEEFADRFEGLGKLTNVQVKIHLNPDVTPVIQPHRRIPFHLRQKVNHPTREANKRIRDEKSTRDDKLQFPIRKELLRQNTTTTSTHTPRHEVVMG